MTLGIRYAARSDVGMLREGNEDSAYAGSYLLAVADGMGGHVGGEIASAAAIEALRKLDKDLPANELLAALDHTVKAANENLHRIVESDPKLQGMGTTLTAMLWAGNQVALVHIGDSRAYLLRDGSLFQITHDHTLVQSLVDEGRISPDEAASHPQRSLLLRALDGRSEVDPDLSLREAKAGDRYLLCSDGLSGVVTAETIFQVLTEVAEPDAAVRRLIDLANRGGGPDNITCVVADVVELGGQPPQPRSGQAVGAAANTSPPDFSSGPGANTTVADTPARRAAQMLGDTNPQPAIAVDDMPPHEHYGEATPAPGTTMPEPAGRRRRATRGGPGVRRWAWLAGALGVVVVGLGVTGFVALDSIRSGYYIGEQNGQVTVFKGTNQKIPLISLSEKAPAKDQPNPPIMTNDLPEELRKSVRETYQAAQGPAKAVAFLEEKVCKYTIMPDNDGRLVAEWARGRGDCGRQDPVKSQVMMNQLPRADQDAFKNGKQVVGRRTVDTELTRLTQQQQLCKSDSPPEGCPPKGGPR